MDPSACWRRILDATSNGDVEEAKAAMADLLDWLNTGGYAPIQWGRLGRGDEAPQREESDDKTKTPCPGCIDCAPVLRASTFAVCMARDPVTRKWCDRPRNHVECGSDHRARGDILWPSNG